MGKRKVALAACSVAIRMLTRTLACMGSQMTLLLQRRWDSIYKQRNNMRNAKNT
jgi:hypothetical protein